MLFSLPTLWELSIPIMFVLSLVLMKLVKALFEEFDVLN